MNRRQFLRGDFQSRRASLRPPWAVAEEIFRGRCRACGECISACRAGILIAGFHDLPEIDFTAGECTFCGECADVCESLALDRKRYKTLPWTCIAVIDEDRCLAGLGVCCASCRDACGTSAIRLYPRHGMAARPVLNADACTGCGACVAPCPTGAIDIRPPSPNTPFRPEEKRCT
jgi:ferredoxin-type protein NapF